MTGVVSVGVCSGGACGWLSLAVGAGLVRAVRGDVRGPRGRLVRGVLAVGRAGISGSVVAVVSGGFPVVAVSVEGVSDGAGSGVFSTVSTIGSSIRAPVAVTRFVFLPVAVGCASGVVIGSASRASPTMGAKAPVKLIRKLPSESFGLRASTRRIKASSRLK